MTGIILPAILGSIRSLQDGSLKLCFDSQELSPANVGEIFSHRGKLVALYISPKETVSQKELDQVDAIDPLMPGRTKSQRQRDVLFRIWEIDPQGHKTFETYYTFRMEQTINDLKKHLDSLSL